MKMLLSPGVLVSKFLMCNSVPRGYFSSHFWKNNEAYVLLWLSFLQSVYQLYFQDIQCNIIFDTLVWTAPLGMVLCYLQCTCCTVLDQLFLYVYFEYILDFYSILLQEELMYYKPFMCSKFWQINTRFLSPQKKYTKYPFLHFPDITDVSNMRTTWKGIILVFLFKIICFSF